MFDLEPYKHPDHKKRRSAKLEFDEMCRKHPEERSLPYYSISVEQMEADNAYSSMNGTDQGDFLRLLRLLWRANGLLQDFSKAIAHDLGFTAEGWEAKRQRFIQSGLLDVSTDGCNLVNRGLRQQYLNTLHTANSRRHKNPEE